MSHKNRFGLLTLAAVMAGTTLITGCTVRAGYYDPYYHDRHQWAAEQPYYYRWERETRRRHEEFRRRHAEEQNEYWEWRHHQH